MYSGTECDIVLAHMSTGYPCDQRDKRQRDIHESLHGPLQVRYIQPASKSAAVFMRIKTDAHLAKGRNQALRLNQNQLST